MSLPATPVQLAEAPTDLSTKSPSHRANRRRRRPGAVRQSRDNHAGTKACSAQESSLEDGDDGNAFGIGQDLRGDDLVWAKCLPRVDERCENAAALFTLASRRRRYRIADPEGHRVHSILTLLASFGDRVVRLGGVRERAESDTRGGKGVETPDQWSEKAQTGEIRGGLE